MCVYILYCQHDTVQFCVCVWFCQNSTCLFLCLFFVFAAHYNQVFQLERSSGHMEANKFFVEKLLESSDTGWFSEFITALRKSGKYLVALVCVHI